MTDIQKAKQYLQSRLDAEASMSRNLSAMLLVFANQLLAIYKKYGVKPDSVLAQNHPDLQREIQNLIRRLKDELYDDVELLSIQADNQQKDHIIALINMSIYGYTLKSRIDYWVNELVLSLNKQISNADFGTFRFRTVPINVGASYGLDRLLRQTISNAFTEIDKERHPSASFFVSHVASSHPCGHCLAMDGVKQPISAYPSWGAYHPNCCCFFIFI